MVYIHPDHKVKDSISDFVSFMIEFIQTLSKGIVQGFRQFITNDLSSYVPLFIIAAVLIIAVQIKNWIQSRH